MNKDDKRRADVLLELSRSCWSNFYQRKSYEWKLSLAIWTPLAAFIAVCLQGEVEVRSCSGQIVLGVGAVLVLALDAFFLFRSMLSNTLEQKKALYL